MLRKKYKNDLYNSIVSKGFDLDNFVLSEQKIEGYPSTTLRYKASPFYFVIRVSNDSFENFDYKFIKFSPGYKSSEFEPTQGWASFETVENAFNIWLEKDIKEFLIEENELDLWAEFQNGNKTFNIHKIDFDDKSAFSSDERNHLVLAINDLKLLIHKNLQTTSEEQFLVDERLTYLLESSVKLNKFDWKGLAISTIISISISLSLDTARGQVLFNLFKKVFSNLPKLLY